MSRGPGTIERAIEAAFKDNPSSTFTVEELAAVAYLGLNRVEKKHRVAIIRAANRVASRCGWQSWRVYRPGHTNLYVNQFDLRSYAIGRMRADFLDGCLSVPDIAYLLDTPDVHKSKWHMVQPDGVWWRHVEINRARRDGDNDRAEAMASELNRSIERRMSRIGRVS